MSSEPGMKSATNSAKKTVEEEAKEDAREQDALFKCPRCGSDKVELSLLDPEDVAFFCWGCRNNIYKKERTKKS